VSDNELVLGEFPSMIECVRHLGTPEMSKMADDKIASGEWSAVKLLYPTPDCNKCRLVAVLKGEPAAV
jgi:hypothetical protein